MTFLKSGGKSVADLGHEPRVHDSHVPPAFAEYKYHFFYPHRSDMLKDIKGLEGCHRDQNIQASMDRHQTAALP